MQSPLTLELGNPASQEVIKPEKKFEYRALDHFIFLDQPSSSRYLADHKQICNLGPVSKRFCPNGFANQPDICVGAIQSVFLSNRRIDALKAATVTVEKFDVTSCCIVDGLAMSLNSCEL